MFKGEKFLISFAYISRKIDRHMAFKPIMCNVQPCVMVKYAIHPRRSCLTGASLRKNYIYVGNVSGKFYVSPFLNQIYYSQVVNVIKAKQIIFLIFFLHHQKFDFRIWIQAVYHPPHRDLIEIGYKPLLPKLYMITTSVSSM